MSVIKRLSLYEFALWGRDLVSLVRIKNEKMYENFVETLETFRNKEVSLPRGSTVVTETFEKRAPL